MREILLEKNILTLIEYNVINTRLNIKWSDAFRTELVSANNLSSTCGTILYIVTIIMTISTFHKHDSSNTVCTFLKIDANTNDIPSVLIIWSRNHSTHFLINGIIKFIFIQYYDLTIWKFFIGNEIGITMQD